MRVSVVTPTRRVDAALKDAIESVRTQDAAFGIEHWVIVDSPDEALPATTDAGNRRLHFVRNRRHAGPSGARNTGLDLATGDIVLFLDADDLWPVQHVRTVFEVFRTHADVACVSTPGFTFGSGVTRSTMTTPLIVDGFMSSRKVAWNAIGCPSGFSFRRTAALAQVRFCEEARYCEDYLFYLALLAAGAVFWRTNDTEYGYRRSPTQSTSLPPRQAVLVSRAAVLRHVQAFAESGALGSDEARIANIQIERLCARLIGNPAHRLSLALCMAAPSWATAQFRRAVRRLHHS